MTTNGRVAAVDVGTNSVLLLIAEGRSESPSAVLERATITRLGQGVDRTKRLSPDAIERTIACLADYGRTARAHGVGSIDVVCTSAARDAENGREFLDAATATLGVCPRIIDGDEEANLTVAGAVTGLGLQGETLVFDVGGGSTEVIVGLVDGANTVVRTAVSLDVGSVRLTERHVQSDPPSPTELAAVRRDIDVALSALKAPSTKQIVGVAGTVTTLSSIHQGLSVYDSARVHGSRLSREAIDAVAREIGSVPLDVRRRTTGLDPGRADVIVAGTEIVRAMLDWSGAQMLIVSDRGVRWGLARAALLR